MRIRSLASLVRGGARACALLTLAAGSSASAKIIYVNLAATGSGNGASWSDAFTGLQSALAIAATGDQIWVAQGTYRPAGPGGDRGASFFLKTGVALYGGFAGGEAALDERDWTAHATILSGDLNGDDGPAFANTEDNSYHVVFALDTDETAVLDGFTIASGHADGPGFGAVPESQDQGSGLNVYFSTPLVQNCTFTLNWAANHASMNDHGGSTVMNCTFRGNYSAQFGAGLYIHHGCATTAMGCTFDSNVAEAEGGGLYCRSMAGAIVTDCTFTNNQAVLGAGMYNALSSTASVSNCTFTGNNAQIGGAGIYCDVASPTILGCIFNENVAGITIVEGGNGGGGSGGGGVWCSGGAATVADCMFANNSASFGGGVYNNEGSQAQVLGCTFDTNIASEAGGCYILSSPATVAGCLFTNNTATGGQFPVGGGLSTYFSDSNIRDCVFTANHSDLGGGGLYTEGSASVIERCRFFTNTALDPQEGWGGGIMVGYNASPAIANCLFVGNRANRGGGIFNIIFSSPLISACTIVANTAGVGGGIQTINGTGAAVVGSIIWANTPTQLDGVPIPVSYSCIQGGAPGTGNILSDPRFVRLPDPGPDGVWGTADDDLGDLRLTDGSGCIDAADNTSIPADLTADLNGDPRFVNDTGTPDSGVGPPPIVDMGAYEFQGTSCYPNCDRSSSSPGLDAADFACFIARFRAGDAWANCDESSQPPVLNVRDFVCFINRFVAGCP